MPGIAGGVIADAAGRRTDQSAADCTFRTGIALAGIVHADIQSRLHRKRCRRPGMAADPKPSFGDSRPEHSSIGPVSLNVPAGKWA